MNFTAMFGADSKTEQHYAFADPIPLAMKSRMLTWKGKFAVCRGECLFANKAHNAEKAGAVGVLVVNTDISLSRMFGGDSKSNLSRYLLLWLVKMLAMS